MRRLLVWPMFFLFTDMAALYNEYTTIKEAFQDLQRLYHSSGRDEQFLNVLYPKELIRFYQGCEYSLRNIIIVSNIHYLPAFMNVNYLKKHFIFVYVVYFDNIEKYNSSSKQPQSSAALAVAAAATSATTKNKSFVDYTSDYLYAKQLNTINSDHNFSKMIGIPKQIASMLSTYPNNEWFNILDLNQYSVKKKHLNCVDFSTFVQKLTE